MFGGWAGGESRRPAKAGREREAESGPGMEEELERPGRTRGQARVPGGARCLGCDRRRLAGPSPVCARVHVRVEEGTREKKVGFLEVAR